MKLGNLVSDFVKLLVCSKEKQYREQKKYKSKNESALFKKWIKILWKLGTTDAKDNLKLISNKAEADLF